MNTATAGMVDPYAEALMALARDSGLTDDFGNDARSILEMVESSPELKDVLANPFVKGDAKKKIFRQLLEGKVHDYFLNFLLLLVDRRRIFLLEDICRQYRVLLRQLKNTVLAEVTATLELNEGQRDAVIQKVKALTNASEVELEVKLDPELIGGVIIKVGSQVLDASIKGQLRRIGISLLTATA
ncbi:ATP synthase F1 subunit delta [Altericista sp. CCNU0014]|uniref:ATP synthase F1 subunit delta n=1 Tax=Altericista sp. CCNU0014 TaxID=3082949 RepID=UPI00384B6E20